MKTFNDTFFKNSTTQGPRYEFWTGGVGGDVPTNFSKFLFMPTKFPKCVSTFFFLLDVFSNVPTSAEMSVNPDSFYQNVSYVPLLLTISYSPFFGICRQVPIKH